MSGTMDYYSFVKSLKNGLLKNTVFLFHGPEQFLAQDALRLLVDHCLPAENREINFQRLDAQELDAQALLQELNTLPFFSQSRVLVIGNSEKYFGTSKKRSPEEEDIVADYLGDINEGCCVVFSMKEKPDSRKKVFKKIRENGYVVEFNSLKGAQLSRWLRSRAEEMGRRIHNDAVDYLITYAGNELSALDHELQKVCLYEPDSMDISLETVRMVISKTAAGGIFDLVDAVGEKKVSKAVDILREMLVAGQAPVYVVYMLARQYRLILSVKSLLKQRIPEKQILSKLSLHPYVFKKVLAQSRNFEEEDLVRGIKQLLEADISLKNSLADPGYTLEMTIMKLAASQAVILG